MIFKPGDMVVRSELDSYWDMVCSKLKVDSRGLFIVKDFYPRPVDRNNSLYLEGMRLEFLAKNFALARVPELDELM
jgi:hypothetical protein